MVNLPTQTIIARLRPTRTTAARRLRSVKSRTPRRLRSLPCLQARPRPITTRLRRRTTRKLSPARRTTTTRTSAGSTCTTRSAVAGPTAPASRPGRAPYPGTPTGAIRARTKSSQASVRSHCAIARRDPTSERRCPGGAACAATRNNRTRLRLPCR